MFGFINTGTLDLKTISYIEINVNISEGLKNFTAYTMDFTKEYIEINADYRS